MDRDDREDPRVARTRAAVLAAATEELADAGYPGFTIDGIVTRTGIAKTTIYRHWPTKADLLLDTIVCFRTQPVAPDTGTLRGDLTVLLGGLIAAIDRDPWFRSLPSLVQAATNDPQIADLHDKLIANRSAALRQVLERSQSRGELRAGLNLDLAIATIVGPVFFFRLILHGKDSDRSLNDHLDVVLQGIARDQ